MNDLPDNPSSAADRIERQLLSMLGGYWRVGDRLPATGDLARRLGTGQRNTHLALRALTRKGYLRARPGQGTFVQSLPEGLIAPAAGDAQTELLTGKRIAMFCITANAPYLPLVNRIERRIRRAGVAVRRIEPDPSSNDLTAAMPDDVDGAILAFPNMRSPVLFDERRSVVVLASSSTLPIHAGKRFDLITPDDWQGALLAGRHARALGCRRPCFVGVADLVADRQYCEVSQLRLDAFQTGLGQTVAEQRCLMADRFTAAAGARVVRAFARLSPLPDLVFAVTDEVAMGLMMGASALGLEAGQDYRLIGFDGMDEGQAADGGPLTTVKRPEHAMARLAVRSMLGRLVSPDLPSRRMQLACSFIKGATTGEAADERAAIQRRGAEEAQP